jgi:hypothetical protein
MCFQYLRFSLCVAVAGGLLLQVSDAAAQQLNQADSTRWYVGAQAGVYAQAYLKGKYDFSGAERTNVVALYGGYSSSPRLAVQAGLRYGRGNTPAEELQGSGQFANYPATYQVISALTVPVQLRWSFAKMPHRFRMEGLAGGSITYYKERYVPARSAAAARRMEVSNGINGFIEFGIGNRLQLYKQLELATDLLLNVNVKRPNNPYFPFAPGYGVACGLNYWL